ncbi:MAG: hypothetical protein ACJ73S_03580 [Mycobacteriales bacterium]
MRQAERRVPVRRVSEPEFVASWLVVAGDLLTRAWRSAPPGADGSRARSYATPDGEFPRLFPGWLGEPAGPYQGRPAERLQLAVRGSEADALRPGAQLLVLDLDAPGDPDWVNAGTIGEPVGSPNPLVDALTDLGWSSTPTKPPDGYRWPSPIRTCEASADDRTLRLTGQMGYGEVLVGVQADETRRLIRVRVQVGIDPELSGLPRLTGQGGGLFRPAVGLAWRAVVHLQAPLADREVEDLAGPEEDGRQKAWRRWMAAHPDR